MARNALIDLQYADPTNAELLLGKDGLLMEALNSASSEMSDQSSIKSAPKRIPDITTCSEIKTLVSLTIAKLIEAGATGDDIETAKKQLEDLSDKIETYSQTLKGKAATTENALDKILEKGTLGEAELNELFGNKDNIATTTITAYNELGKDPIEGIKILVIKGLYERFKSAANEAGISKGLSSKIAECSFFKVNSWDYKLLEETVNEIDIEKLKLMGADVKEKLEKYATEIKLVDDIKVE